MRDIFQEIRDAVINGNAEKAEEKTKEALEEAYDRQEILRYSLMPAMDIVGKQFDTNVIFVADVLLASRAMRTSLEILKSSQSKIRLSNKCRIVIGTVQGDIHDIGKNIVAMMFEGSGFEVVDLGVDVSPSRFVEAVLQYKPDVLGLSALLTTIERTI
jgi:5-methyltetrahydrofolate--homocysteine methyltransferase